MNYYSQQNALHNYDVGKLQQYKYIDRIIRKPFILNLTTV